MLTHYSMMHFSKSSTINLSKESIYCFASLQFVMEFFHSVTDQQPASWTATQISWSAEFCRSMDQNRCDPKNKKFKNLWSQQPNGKMMSLVLTRSAGLARHRPPFKGSCEGPMLVRSSNTTLPKWVTAVCMDEMPAFCTSTSHEPWACTRRNRPAKLTKSSGTSPSKVMISKTSNARKIFKTWLGQSSPAMSLVECNRYSISCSCSSCSCSCSSSSSQIQYPHEPLATRKFVQSRRSTRDSV